MNTNRWRPLGGGGGMSKFTLIELLVVLLVLGILMAIAIPLISGVREATNNTECRANLTQLHAALMAYSEMDGQPFPNIAGSRDLGILIASGYIKEGSKLGDCPGHEGKQKLTDSSYEGGPELTGDKNTLALTEKAIILADVSDSSHKAGKNKIRLDGSFTQEGPPQLSQAEETTEPDQADNEELDDLIVTVYNVGGKETAADVDKVRRILDGGADPNARQTVAGDPPTSGYTALHYAAKRGYTRIAIELLKEEDIKPNLKTQFRYTPLHYAALNGYTDIVKELLKEEDIKPNAQTQFRYTALHFAALHGYTDIVKELLKEEDIKVNAAVNTSGYTPLHYAAQNGYTDIVKELLKEKDIEVNAAGDTSGYTPLHYAAQNGHTDIVKELLKEKDIKVNALDISGYTPLHYAAQNGHTDIVKELLKEKDIEVNAAGDTSGYTPLHYAAERGYTDIVKELLKEKDINPNLKSYTNRWAVWVWWQEDCTASDVARNADHPAIAALIAAHPNYRQ